MAAEPELVLRRVRPSDAAALERFYAELSAASRRARFLGACAGLSFEQSRMFCTPDHSHAEGFVALVPGEAGDPATERLVGHLCLEPIDAQRVELAVAVADEWQRRGIGRRLFEAALEWCQQHRYGEIVATAYADNGAVLRLLSSAPYGARVGAADAGVVNVTIPLLAPLPAEWRDLSAARGTRPRRSVRRRPMPSPRRPLAVWQRTRPPARGAAG